MVSGVRGGDAGWGHPAYMSKRRYGCGRGALTPLGKRKTILPRRAPRSRPT